MFFSSFDSVYRLCADVQYIYFMTDFLSVLEGEGHQQNGGQIRWRPSLVLKDSNWLRWLPLVVVGSGVQIAPLVVPTTQSTERCSFVWMQVALSIIFTMFKEIGS